jgi:hypothetical protein
MHKALGQSPAPQVKMKVFVLNSSWRSLEEGSKVQSEETEGVFSSLVTAFLKEAKGSQVIFAHSIPSFGLVGALELWKKSK